MTTLLCIDVARSSGWCLRCGGAYSDSGQVDAFGEAPADLCRRAIEIDRKAVLVLEQPSHGNRATLVGLGAARGAWLAAWKNATGLRTLARVKSVYPATWRSKLFGNVSGFALQERLHAQLVSKKTDPGADESAAVCIASWAERELEKNLARKSAARTRSACRG